jgi:hypothetical protein
MRTLIVLLLLSVAGPMHAQTWTFRFIAGTKSGELITCNAEIYYPDGAMAVRIYGEEMDLYFDQETLAVPRGKELGNVVLAFKSDIFLLSAQSAHLGEQPNTSSMYLTPLKSDYSKILDDLKRESMLSIVFPDGTKFGVGLKNSDRALAQVADCWLKNATGPAGRNPFAGTDRNNPFN